MPTELTPPFDTTARDPRDEQLVGEVLGKTAAGEMTELAGSDTSQPETIPANLEVTKNEQTATKDAEKNPAERRREQYHIWAVKHGKDEEWVDRKFIFEKNGQVRVDETLRLHEMGISEFPPGLYRVNGNLTAGNNEFTEIKNVPEGVMELFLNNNRISVIENIPETVKKLVLCHNRISVIQNIPASVNDLDLDNNPTESLEPLSGRTFIYLSLCNINAKTIPRGIRVNEIAVYKEQTDLIADARAKGYNLRVFK